MASVDDEDEFSPGSEFSYTRGEPRSPNSEANSGHPNHYMSASSQYASSVASARSDRADPMHEFMEIAKQTRLMALATQGELVTTHSHIKRFERLLDTEREARLRLESEFQSAMSDTRRTIMSLREELAALAASIYKVNPRASAMPSFVCNPGGDALLQVAHSGSDVEPWARFVDLRSVDAETRRMSDAHSRIVQVELRKIDGKLGVGLGGGNTAQPLFIQSLAPGSAAYLDGRLCVGDRILKIDGFHVDRASYEGAVALLRTTEDVVVFEVARSQEKTSDQDSDSSSKRRSTLIRPIPVKVQPQANESETFTIELTKDAHGLGFTVAGIENASADDVCNVMCRFPSNMMLLLAKKHSGGLSCGIFVDRINEVGVAAIDGRLKVGDQVVAVDGQTLTGKTHITCMNILRSTARTVQLAIMRSKQPTQIPRAVDNQKGLLKPDSFTRSSSDATKSEPSEKIFYPPGRNDRSNSPFRELGEELSPKAVLSPSKPKAELKKAQSLEAYKAKFSGMKILLLALNKGESGLGLGIRGGTSTSQTQGIYVENIVDGGAAHAEGGLRVKDRILAVNDVDLTDATKSDAIKVLKNAGDRVSMVIARAKPTVEPTTHM